MLVSEFVALLARMSSDEKRLKSEQMDKLIRNEEGQ